MRRKLYITFLVLTVSGFVYAQDSLIMYNGQYYKGKVIEFNNNDTKLKFEVQKKNKSKIKLVQRADVFAIYYKDSISRVFYEPLMTEERPWTTDEIGRYIAGENLARYRYHAPWASAVGAVTGVGLLQIGMFGIAVPAAYMGVVAAIPVNPKSKKYFPTEKLNDEYYVEGFKYVARRKKLVNAAIGSAAGIVVFGTIAAIITFRYYND